MLAALRGSQAVLKAVPQFLFHPNRSSFYNL
jgi:hypothetical protein